MFFISMPGTGLRAIRTSTWEDSVIAVFFAYAPDSVRPRRCCFPHCFSSGITSSAAWCDVELVSGITRYFSTIEAAYWSGVITAGILALWKSIGRKRGGVERGGDEALSSMVCGRARLQPCRRSHEKSWL